MRGKDDTQGRCFSRPSGEMTLWEIPELLARFQRSDKEIMLEFAFFFFALAVIAALLGFFGLVGLAALVAKAICVAFLILFLIATFRQHRHR